MSVIGSLPDDSAMKKLIQAFDRWQKEDSQAQKEIKPLTNVQKIVKGVLESEEQTLIPDPAPFAFLATLCPIEPLDLADDNRECHICMQTYHSISDQQRNNRMCVATCLPCNHIVGKWCMFKWLSPFNGMYNNSCPFCRMVLFPKPPSMETVQGMQERIDLVDWCAQEVSRVPSAREKVLITSWTRSIVLFRLEEARRELHEDAGTCIDKWREGVDSRSPYTSLELESRKALLDGMQTMVEISDLSKRIARDEAQLGRVNEVMEQHG